jgi:hypothetical protein
VQERTMRAALSSAVVRDGRSSAPSDENSCSEI